MAFGVHPHLGSQVRAVASPWAGQAAHVSPLPPNWKGGVVEAPLQFRVADQLGAPSTLPQFEG